jgi:hypothetical protein
VKTGLFKSRQVWQNLLRMLWLKKGCFAAAAADDDDYDDDDDNNDFYIYLACLVFTSRKPSTDDFHEPSNSITLQETHSYRKKSCITFAELRLCSDFF